MEEKKVYNVDMSEFFGRIQRLLEIDNKNVSMEEIERLFFFVLNSDLYNEFLAAVLAEYYLLIGDFDKVESFCKKPKKMLMKLYRKVYKDKE